MHSFRNFILLLVVLMTVPFQAAATNAAEKPTIVLTAFGTSVEDARKVFDFIDQQARRRYPEYDLRWAFTSQFIIDKLKKRGVVTHNVEETIAELRRQGKTRVAFQSLHVVPGEEYRSVLAADTSGLQVAYGDALLSSDQDMEQVIAALSGQIDVAQPTVLVAHGNDKHPEFNRQIEGFAAKIEARYPQLVVASVEGLPGTEPLQRIRQLRPQQISFVPLMVVAGDHILNDVLGDEADSWKNLIGVPQPLATPSLGWNPAILDIYFDHLDQALARLEQG